MHLICAAGNNGCAGAAWPIAEAHLCFPSQLRSFRTLLTHSLSSRPILPAGPWTAHSFMLISSRWLQVHVLTARREARPGTGEMWKGVQAGLLGPWPCIQSSKCTWGEREYPLRTGVTQPWELDGLLPILHLPLVGEAQRLGAPALLILWLLCPSPMHSHPTCTLCRVWSWSSWPQAWSASHGGKLNARPRSLLEQDLPLGHHS